MPSGNNMVDSTLPDFFDGRLDDEENIDYTEPYEPEEREENLTE